MDRITEVGVKHDRIRNYLALKNFDALLLSSIANFSWLTAGGDSHVENHNKFGIASIFVTPQKKYILTNNIEAERLTNEQLDGVGSEFEFVVSKWFDVSEEEANLQKLIGNKKIASDTCRNDCVLLKSDFQALRYQLTESEIVRYRWLGKKCGEAIEKVAKKITPGMTEHEIEANMAKALTVENILPVVLLVAGDERNYRYRHPVPTENRFNQFAKMVCCARRWGLIAALTRSVYAGTTPPDLINKHAKAAYVDSVFISQTKPGANVNEIFKQAVKAYEKAGFPGEWENHHQGGGIGYDSREFIATLSSKEIVINPQAFAWNPSIHGNKSEDTVLISSQEPEIITMTDEWPRLEINIDGKIFKRPAIFEI